VRRLLTRLLAVVPAAIVAGLAGERGVGQLLILSQVVLSLQLSFAVIPLVKFTNDKLKMGRFVNAPWLAALSWVVALVIAALNAWLLIDTVKGWLHL
jgi:manganese transport protein